MGSKLDEEQLPPRQGSRPLVLETIEEPRREMKRVEKESRPSVLETIEESRSKTKRDEKESAHQAHTHAPYVLQAEATPEGANLTLTPESQGVRFAEQTSKGANIARDTIDAARELDALARAISRRQSEKAKAASIEDFDRAQELKVEIEQLIREAEDLKNSPFLSELGLGHC